MCVKHVARCLALGKMFHKWRFPNDPSNKIIYLVYLNCKIPANLIHVVIAIVYTGLICLTTTRYLVNVSATWAADYWIAGSA